MIGQRAATRELGGAAVPSRAQPDRPASRRPRHRLARPQLCARAAPGGPVPGGSRPPRRSDEVGDHLRTVHSVQSVGRRQSSSDSSASRASSRRYSSAAAVIQSLCRKSCCRTDVRGRGGCMIGLRERGGVAAGRRVDAALYRLSRGLPNGVRIAAMTETSARRDRRADRHAATTREILDAAWGLARERGLAGWALRDVAEAVGMRAPSLYGYFDSKNALYDAMFADGYAELLARVGHVVPGPPRRATARRPAAGAASSSSSASRTRRGCSCSSCGRSRASNLGGRLRAGAQLLDRWRGAGSGRSDRAGAARPLDGAAHRPRDAAGQQRAGRRPMAPAGRSGRGHVRRRPPAAAPLPG